MSEAARQLVTREMTDLIVYPESEEGIAELAERYRPLVIKDLADKRGYLSVREARLDVKRRRVAVGHRRKEVNEDALRFTRDNNKRAEKLTGLLAEIEAPLQEREEWYTAEQARIKAEAEEEQAAKLQERMDLLAAVDGTLPVMVVTAMTDKEFTAALQGAVAAYELAQQAIADAEAMEAARLEAERVAREAEEARLAEIRAEQERQAVALRAEQEKLAAERNRLEAEKQAQEDARRAEEERVASEKAEALRIKEAAALAAQEALERVEREAMAKQEAERLAALEAERLELLRPDCEKLRAYSTALLDVPVPVMDTDAAFDLLGGFRTSLLELTTALTKGAEGL